MTNLTLDAELAEARALVSLCYSRILPMPSRETIGDTIDALIARVEKGEALIDGLTKCIRIERPDTELAQGKLALEFILGPDDQYYVLMLASNSYDEAALNDIGGWLSQMHAFLSTTSTPPLKENGT